MFTVDDLAAGPHDAAGMHDAAGARNAAGLHHAAGLGICDIRWSLLEAFSGGGEAILELRLGETVVEIIARTLRIGGERAGTRGLAALGESER